MDIEIDEQEIEQAISNEQDSEQKDLTEKQKWEGLRENLKHSHICDSNWEEAIQLFDNRLKRKFFNPIQLVLDKRIGKGEGFAIVTVQCALIEMFAAFKEGKIFNPNLRQERKKQRCIFLRKIFNIQQTNNSVSYEYNDPGKIFKKFLRTASIFENMFWQKNHRGRISPDLPFKSRDFYEQVRCGLIHEARTKGNWHINTAPSSIKVKTEPKFIVEEDDKKKIYRTVLHYRLLFYLNEYKEKLRENTDEGKLLRKYFARKLDDLFDKTDDKAEFDWWNED
jgi:hypothetical protein